jgi:hypothetical protein
MKQIQPVSIWDKGTTHEGNKFQCYSTFDNFENSATLYYAIYEDSKMLVSGNLSLNGEDYEAWDSDPSANQWAYNWAAEQLNLTIIGDYIPPVVESSIEPIIEAPIVEE